MTLEQLRIFVAVAERQHVTAAARALNLTQSAVSNAVASLEQRHGVPLFDRVGRGVALNAAGRAFLPEAKGVLARAHAAEAVLADLGALRRGRVAVFASQTIASYWLPRRLVAFHVAHPAVELDLKVGNTAEAAGAVLAGEAEIGFIEGEVEEPLLVQEAVDSDRLAVLVAPDHPWADGRALSAPDLLGVPWVLRERGSGTRSSFEAALAVRGADPAALDVVMALPSNEAVLAAAEAGAGATALSLSVAEASLAAGRLVRACIRLPARRFVMLRHRQRYRSRAAEAFATSVLADGARAVAPALSAPAVC